MNVHLCKPVVDSVQFWIDDIAQLFERISNAAARDTDTESGDSRDISLIGSRFFAKSSRSKSSGGSSQNTLTQSRPNTNSEVVIKLVIAEGLWGPVACPNHTMTKSFCLQLLPASLFLEELLQKGRSI
jgi:autophagy-related protein 2